MSKNRSDDLLFEMSSPYASSEASSPVQAWRKGKKFGKKQKRRFTTHDKNESQQRLKGVLEGFETRLQDVFDRYSKYVWQTAEKLQTLAFLFLFEVV